MIGTLEPDAVVVIAPAKAGIHRLRRPKPDRSGSRLSPGMRQECPATDRVCVPWLRRVLIGLPFLWLAVFFLAPLLIVAGISLAESADAIPPFEPPLAFGPQGIESHLTAANYRQLAEGCSRIYARSVGYAASTTLLCLLIGFPMALAIARAPESRRGAAAVSGGPAVLD